MQATRERCNGQVSLSIGIQVFRINRKEVFSGCSVGSCINEEELSVTNLRKNFADILTDCSSHHRALMMTGAFSQNVGTVVGPAAQIIEF